MAIKYANNASTTLSIAITDTTATSITVANGSVFPALATGDTTYVTLSTTDGNTTEIVKVTGISTNILTVERGTSPQTFSIGDLCELRLTKELLEDTVDDLAPSTLATVAIVETVDSTGTIDLTNGTIFKVETAVSSLTLPVAAAADAGKSFTIIAGPGIISGWTNPPIWSGGVTPSQTNRVIYSFLCDGTNWYGMEVGNGFGGT
jgi:hypothetical protein